jgi:hypothetical protein
LVLNLCLDELNLKIHCFEAHQTGCIGGSSYSFFLDTKNPNATEYASTLRNPETIQIGIRILADSRKSPAEATETYSVLVFAICNKIAKAAIIAKILYNAKAVG